MSAYNTNSTYLENRSTSRPSKFDPKEFQTWKSRMMLHFESIDTTVPSFAENWPFVPNSPLDVPASETIHVTTREVVKESSLWIEEDKRKVGLDVNARTHIAISLSNFIYNSVCRLLISKQICDTLDVASKWKDEVKENNIIFLKVNMNYSFVIRENLLWICRQGSLLS